MDDLKLYGKTDKRLDLQIQIVRIFNWTEKCKILIPNRGIKDENCDTKSPNDLKTSSLKEGGNHKYQGILEAEDINIPCYQTTSKYPH